MAAVTAGAARSRGLDPVAPGGGLEDEGGGADGSCQRPYVEGGRSPERDECVRRCRPRGAGRQAVWGPFEHDAARGHDDDAVGHFLGFSQLVGGEDDADALRLQVRHHAADSDPPLGVDTRRGLVEEGHLGLPDQCQGQGEALLLPAREVPPGRGGHRAEADEVEQVGRWEGVDVVAGEEVQDAARPEHRVHAPALEHDADAAAERGVVGDGVEPEDAHVACGRPPVALEGLDRRGLARSVGSEHDEHLAGVGREVHAVHGGRRCGPVAHGESR